MWPQLFLRHIYSDFDFSDTPNCGRGTLLSDKNADLVSNQSHEHALANLFQIKQLNHSEDFQGQQASIWNLYLADNCRQFALSFYKKSQNETVGCIFYTHLKDSKIQQ